MNQDISKHAGEDDNPSAVNFTETTVKSNIDIPLVGLIFNKSQVPKK